MSALDPAPSRFYRSRFSIPSFWRRVQLQSEYEAPIPEPGDILMVVRTGEIVKVQRSGERLTYVERGLGTIPVAIRSGDELVRVGNLADA